MPKNKDLTAFIILVGITFVSCVIAITIAYNSYTHQPLNCAANVNQCEDVFIFVDAEPINEHEHICNLILDTLQNSYHARIQNIVTQVVKIQFPQANGLEVNFDNNTATVIKFK